MLAGGDGASGSQIRRAATETPAVVYVRSAWVRKGSVVSGEGRWYGRKGRGKGAVGTKSKVSVWLDGGLDAVSENRAVQQGPRWRGEAPPQDELMVTKPVKVPIVKPPGLTCSERNDASKRRKCERWRCDATDCERGRYIHADVEDEAAGAAEEDDGDDAGPADEVVGRAEVVTAAAAVEEEEVLSHASESGTT